MVRLRSAATLIGTALLALLFLEVASLGFGPVGGGPSDDAGTALAQSDVEPDAILIEVSLADDGTALWQVHYRTRLDDENVTEAFESLQSDIEDDPTPYLERFGERMNRTVTGAESATGREMAVENVTVGTDRIAIPREYGVVTYTFEWKGFAVVDGDQLRVGDAIAGLFLDDETRLQLRWPDGYRAIEFAPDPSDERTTSAVWDGPIEFGGDEPRIVLSRADPTVDDERSGGSLIASPLGIGVLVLLTVLGIGGWLLFKRRRTTTSDDHTPVDDELLSNEELVLQLLETHGGRMKQKEVAEELGWTAAKTSNVVKGLRDDGTLEGFRLGRENVLTLPDENEESSVDGAE